METLNYRQVHDMLVSCMDKILRNEPYLTRADSAIGDGDHGVGMCNGAEAAKRALAECWNGDNVYQMYASMAAAMQAAMGGASGMIFSTLYAGDAESHAPASEITAADLAELMASGLAAIKGIGGAAPGDKTMVDALEPAARTMVEHADEGFVPMLNAAVEAAAEGMEATKNMVAKYGRSKSLGERALGFQDAGATSVWLILTQMRDYVCGTTTPDPDPNDLPKMEEPGDDALTSGHSGSKKIINDPHDVVKESAEGFLAAYGEYFEAIDGVRGLIRKDIPEGKTALVIGGGSGHEPMFGYFLGEGLADATASGNVFASPDPTTIRKTAEAANRGAGVMFVYGNYAGDNLNFDKAADELEAEGIPVATVRVKDDVVSAPRERYDDRRGIAGDIFVVKIAGAACTVLDLEEAERVVAKARDNVFTIGIGLSGATLPGQTEPIFTLPDDEIEYGMGAHGEPGIRRAKLEPADTIVEGLLSVILEDSGIQAGDTVCTCVNSLGSTTLMELMIMNRKLRQLLDERGIITHDMLVGSFLGTQEMAGASISLMRCDEETLTYYDMPCNSPYFPRFR